MPRVGSLTILKIKFLIPRRVFESNFVFQIRKERQPTVMIYQELTAGPILLFVYRGLISMSTCLTK